MKWRIADFLPKMKRQVFIWCILFTSLINEILHIFMFFFLQLDLFTYLLYSSII